MNYFRKGLRKTVKYLGGKKALSPSVVIKLLHLIETLRWPDLKNPKDINEKLMWLELYSDTSKWTELADKYKVRDFVKEKGFEENLIPLLGNYNDSEEINFSDLPQSFVIKSRNGSGQNLIVWDKDFLNDAEIKKNIKEWNKQSFGFSTGEKHYIPIPQGFIIESLLSENTYSLPVDYKFYCFKGHVKACLVCSERNMETHQYKLNLIDPMSWTEIPGSVIPSMRGNVNEIPRPSALEEMKKIASELSLDFPFVRVDLYQFRDKVYFGEMTFTPAGCHSNNLEYSILKEFGALIPILK